MKRPRKGQQVRAVIGVREYAAEVIESKPGCVSCWVDRHGGEEMVFNLRDDVWLSLVTGARMRNRRTVGVQVAGAVE